MIPKEEITKKVIENPNIPRYRRFGPDLMEFFEEINLRSFFKSKSKVLEVGCGIGKTIEELCMIYNIEGYGVDLSIENFIEPPIPPPPNPDHYRDHFKQDKYEWLVSRREKLIENTTIPQKKQKRYDLLLKLKLRSKPELISADAETLPFSTGYFDRVYSYRTLQYVYDKLKAIAEIHRVLKIGGIALIDIKSPWSNEEEFMKPSAKTLLTQYINDGQMQIKTKNRLELERKIILNKKSETPLVFPRLKDVKQDSSGHCTSIYEI